MAEKNVRRNINVTVGPIHVAEWAVIDDPKDSGLENGTLMIKLAPDMPWMSAESVALGWESEFKEQYLLHRQGAKDREYLETLGELRDKQA